MKKVRTSVLTVLSVLFISSAALAQTSPSQFEGIKIKNFGQMTENYYRGAQPEPDDYAALAKLGITTIIDLRNDPTDYEKSAAEAVGIRYINIPMSGWKKPKDEDIKRFLSILDDPATGKVYVHCKAGKHRTGITGAIYRMEREGWDFEKAYKEMKNYNFTSWMVHFALKDYVEDYAERLEAQRAAMKTATATTAAGTAN